MKLAEKRFRFFFDFGLKAFLNDFLVISMRLKGPSVVGEKSYLFKRLAYDSSDKINHRRIKYGAGALTHPCAFAGRIWNDVDALEVGQRLRLDMA